jgi:hypothetical protein
LIIYFFRINPGDPWGFVLPLPRMRNVFENHDERGFTDLYREIWDYFTLRRRLKFERVFGADRFDHEPETYQITKGANP